VDGAGRQQENGTENSTHGGLAGGMEWLQA
jgi:hypothetical protein